MWVKVHLLIIMCFPGLWEEWAGLLRSGRQREHGITAEGELHFYLVHFHPIFDCTLSEPAPQLRSLSIFFSSTVKNCFLFYR